jgi:monoamine oxidase
MNVRHAQASLGRLQAHGVRWAWHAIGAHIWWLLMAGRALITGATGFVGRRLASALAQFRRQFWEHDDGILGGTTATDLPIRRIVYPSHGGPDEQRGVLLASYNWGQDAACWGALTPEDGVALALKDLAKIHPQAPDELEAGASYAWYNDPHAGGAFALFEPGQESALQAHILTTEGRVHFAVEHCSLWHAWIQRALESVAGSAPGVPSTRRRSRPPLGAQVG